MRTVQQINSYLHGRGPAVRAVNILIGRQLFSDINRFFRNSAETLANTYEQTFPAADASIGAEIMAGRHQLDIKELNIDGLTIMQMANTEPASSGQTENISPTLKNNGSAPAGASLSDHGLAVAKVLPFYGIALAVTTLFPPAIPFFPLLGAALHGAYALIRYLTGNRETVKASPLAKEVPCPVTIFQAPCLLAPTQPEWEVDPAQKIEAARQTIDRLLNPKVPTWLKAVARIGSEETKKLNRLIAGDPESYARAILDTCGLRAVELPQDDQDPKLLVRGTFSDKDILGKLGIENSNRQNILLTVKSIGLIARYKKALNKKKSNIRNDFKMRAVIKYIDKLNEINPGLGIILELRKMLEELRSLATPTVIGPQLNPVVPAAGGFVSDIDYVPPSILAGMLLDDKRHKFMKELGRGGMAVAVQVLDTVTNAVIVLKVPLPHLLSDKSAMKRFTRREMESMRKLRDIQGVVRFLGLIEFDPPYRTYEQLTGVSIGRLNNIPKKFPCISMEYVAHPTLGKALKKAGGKFSVRRAIAVAIDLANTLQKVDEKGILHRDLKPDNIFLITNGEDETTKIADFGIAKPAIAEGTMITQAGNVIGTAEYMSPEQWQGKEDIDRRSDQYTLGNILFEMLTGELPFGDVNDPNYISNIVNPELEAPDIREKIEAPDRLAIVLKRMLAKNRENRYEFWADCLKALNTLI